MSQEIVEVLRQLLGSEYVLYVKTQNAHWNLVGPSFYSLHKLFQKQYEQLAEMIDRIAERIRMYGAPAPGSMQEFLSLNTGFGEIPGRTVADLNLVEELQESNQGLVEVIRSYTRRQLDLPTETLLSDLLDMHMKNTWMLGAHL